MLSSKEYCKESDYKEYITERDVQIIIRKYFNNDNNVLVNYCIQSASTKMLGFLCDYLKITISTKNKKTQANHDINCFVKCISKINKAKADMVRDHNLFYKELILYSDLKEKLFSSDIKQWSPRFITSFDEALVLTNINTEGYKISNKFVEFNESHTLQALKTLAAFHASSIIFEEKTSEKLKSTYRLKYAFEDVLNTTGAYVLSDPWFIQCKIGALKAIQTMSKFCKNNEFITIINNNWETVWESALRLCDYSMKHRNVICHRDLWNNNILFQYKNNEPEDCLLVDFQAIKLQPPAGDVMFLLYCNLEPRFREENMGRLLNYYYTEFEHNLNSHGISSEVLSKEEFLQSSEEQRLWGLIASACLLPTIWIDDDLLTEIFTDTAHFDNILCKDKTSFIIKMMENNINYKNKILAVFEEIVEKYILVTVDGK